ncbi:MAG: hypothetical protein JF886_10810 [Candidatus Dormibacteraeota bacterium]|uniref:Squalene cyclase C-terminal domain-containing protein n=1 Tax=Candidatus Aeolococcus gillhamiae TaxID=3127015 RepID=A0A2W6A7N7_9BACT|nr:hypothetical protein [Candidatus Dormibacteraeota bacterium]PZR79514.1 MAG: hypothetical protein DLM65_10560 [Candidatus Dormibacter sp. RRmetagenome_bin12]
MRRQTGAVGATLTACGLILTSGLVASAATAQTAQANAALRYLYAQVHADGSIAGSFGATEDTVISIADNGYDPATLKSSSTGTSAYDYLSAHASAINTAGGAAKYVLTWVAAGRPTAIDASAWLTKLNTATGSGGFLEPNGAFHNASATVETANAYSQSLSALADVAAGHSLPTNATGWLTCAQRTDGGFGYAIDDSAASPPASCGATSSDTNDTAIIIQALGQAGIGLANGAAKTYLKSTQHPDGGFGFNAAPGSDPSSDTVVIQALVAIGENPMGAAWTVSGKNPVSNLESFADRQGGGGYVFPGNAAPDAFTTSSVPQALALKPYAHRTAIVLGSAPGPATTTPVTASPTSSVQAISVPPTGSAGEVGGASVWAFALLALGSVALLVASFRRGQHPAP